MKIIRIYNNNVIHAYIDEKEIIAIGKGLAFGYKSGDDVPEEKAEKIFELTNTFSPTYIQDLFKELDINNLKFIESIVAYIEEELSTKFSSSAFLSLYDHINVANRRVDEQKNVPNLMNNELSKYYKKEYVIAKKVVEMMGEFFKKEFPLSEVSFITIHIIDLEMNIKINNIDEITSMIKMISEKVNEQFLNINQSSADYERFLIHLRYFSERVITENRGEESSNIVNIYEKFQLEFDKQYAVVKTIVELIKKYNGYYVSIDEQFYLLIHIVKITESNN